MKKSMALKANMRERKLWGSLLPLGRRQHPWDGCEGHQDGVAVTLAVPHVLCHLHRPRPRHGAGTGGHPTAPGVISAMVSDSPAMEEVPAPHVPVTPAGSSPHHHRSGATACQRGTELFGGAGGR